MFNLICFRSLSLPFLTDKQTFAKVGINSLFVHLLMYVKFEATIWWRKLGESGSIISEHIKEDSSRDLKSHTLKYSIECGHANVSNYDFKIIAKNFNNRF